MRLDVSDPENIWARNPHLRSYPIAKRFCKKHGEEWFNKVYYAVYAVYDPLSPERRGYEETSLSKLRKSVKSDYFEEEEYEKFNWTQIKPLGEEYEQKAITKEKKLLNKLYVKLSEMQAVVDDAPIETQEDIARVAKNITSMLGVWELYNDTKRKAEEDELQSTTGYGGTHLNLIESELG